MGRATGLRQASRRGRTSLLAQVVVGVPTSSVSTESTRLSGHFVRAWSVDCRPPASYVAAMPSISRRTVLRGMAGAAALAALPDLTLALPAAAATTTGQKGLVGATVFTSTYPG